MWAFNELVQKIFSLWQDVADLKSNLENKVSRVCVQPLLYVFGLDTLMPQIDCEALAVVDNVDQASWPHQTAIN